MSDQRIRVVIDTCVLVAAAHSRRGASFAVVRGIPSPDFETCLSIGLYAEWRDVLTRFEHLPPGQTPDDALEFLRYLAAESHLQQIHFLWRPALRDSNDDMVLELAVAAHCRFIVALNERDFRGSERFGVSAISPFQFLQQLRVKNDNTSN